MNSTKLGKYDFVDLYESAIDAILLDFRTVALDESHFHNSTNQN